MTNSNLNNDTIKCFAFSPYPTAGASFRYRVLQYEDMMQDAGIRLRWYSFLGNYFYSIRRRNGKGMTIIKLYLAIFSLFRLLSALSRAASSNVIIIHREIFPLGPPIFEALIQRLTPKIIFDIDDAIFHAPTTGVDQRCFLRDPCRVAKTAAMAKTVTVGSPYLHKKISSWNKNCHLLPTAVDTALYFPVHKNQHARPVIGWIGNWGNAIYVETIMQILSKISTQHDFLLRLVGGDDIFSIQPQGVSVEYSLWSLADEIKELSTFDIGIMPLTGGPYDKGKGAFKLIQYMGMGIPVVASPVGMNQQVVDHGVNGFLASTPEDWAVYLMTLMNDSNLRHKMGTAGRKKVERLYSKKNIGKKLIEIIKEVAIEQ